MGGFLSSCISDELLLESLSLIGIIFVCRESAFFENNRMPQLFWNLEANRRKNLGGRGYRKKVLHLR